MASIEKRTTKKGISYTIIVSNGYDVTGKKNKRKSNIYTRCNNDT